MSGYLHIFALESAASDAPLQSAFQVNYFEPGTTFVRALDRTQLDHLLTATVGMSHTEFEAVMARLKSTGRANIADVELSHQETAALGMEQIPSET